MESPRIESFVSGAIEDFNKWDQYVEQFGLLGKIYKWLTGYETKMLANIADLTGKLLDEQEAIAVKFNEKNGIKTVNEDFLGNVDKTTVVAKKAIALLVRSNQEEISLKKSLIERKVIALNYRIKDTINESIDEEAKLLKVKVEEITVVGSEEALKTVTQQFETKAQKFKDATYPITVKKLSNDEIQLLQETAETYPDFIDFLMTKGNESTLKEFFKWTIQNKCPPKIFVEFPHIQTTLQQSYLASRIGIIGNNLLKIDFNENGEKDVTLSFVTSEGKKDVSILNHSRRLNFQSWNSQNEGKKKFLDLPIQNIWDEFVKKNDTDDTCFEVFQDGVTLFNSSKYDGIDLTKDNWYEDLPVYKEVSADELKKLYGKTPQDEEWLVTVKSANQKEELDFAGNHAFLEVAIPDRKGNYRLYPFGKYPKVFPTGALASLNSLGNTVEGHIIFDQNIYYTMRRMTSVPLTITKDQGTDLMNSIKNDVELANNGKLPFQLMNENNCSGWVESKLNHIFKSKNQAVEPRLFRVHVLQLDAPEPIGLGLRIVQALYFSYIKTLLLTMGQYLVLRPTRGLNVGTEDKPEWKTLSDSSYWKEFKLYHPRFQINELCEDNLLVPIVKET